MSGLLPSIRAWLMGFLPSKLPKYIVIMAIMMIININNIIDD
jgi:hypothetical protein